MVIEIWGKQKPPKSKKNVNTKDILSKQALARGNAGGETNAPVSLLAFISSCSDTSERVGRPFQAPQTA